MAQPAIDASGTLTYTPKPNAHGTAIITVVLQDDGGGSDASPQVSFNIVISKTHRLHNALDVGARNGLDVTGSTSTQPDGFIVAGDVITVINYINAKGSGHIPESGPSGPPYCDVNFDDEVVAEDVLKIINYINSHPGQSEAEAESPDSYFDALTGASQATPANSTSGALADVFVLLATDIASSQAKRRRLSAS